MEALHQYSLLEAGDQVLVGSLFKDGERVDVIGTSRGKGFQGVVKRHHFAGGAATHGSMFHLILRRDAETLNAAALRLARADSVWTWGRFYPSELPGISAVELSIGDATLEWTPSEFRTVIERLLAV